MNVLAFKKVLVTSYLLKIPKSQELLELCFHHLWCWYSTGWTVYYSPSTQFFYSPTQNLCHQ